MLFLDTMMQKAAYGRMFTLLLDLPLHDQSLRPKKKPKLNKKKPKITFRRNRQSVNVLALDWFWLMLGCARRGNEVGGDGQDGSSGQDGTGRSWSLPSQLFETWQRFPQEHVGALQRQPTAHFSLHQLKLCYQWPSPHFQYLSL